MNQLKEKLEKLKEEFKQLAPNYIEVENQILSVGKEFLPKVAQKLLKGKSLSTEEEIEYYNFLIDQITHQD